MKLLFLFLMIIIPGCSIYTSKQNIEEKNTVTILSINDISLKDNYVIEAMLVGFSDTIIIVSKKLLNDDGLCKKKIEILHKYRLKLNEIKHLDTDGFNFFFNLGSLYVDNRLVIRKGRSVFVSSNLQGLCIMPGNKND